MKKINIRLLLILVCLISFQMSFAQEINVSAQAKFYYNQGIDYYKTGQYDRSMEAFRKAIEEDASYVDAYYNLASILEYLKQDEEALSIFKKIIVRSPNDYDAIYRAAQLSSKLGNSQQAKSYLSLIPQNSTTYKKAQDLLMTLGNAEQPAAKEETSLQTQETPPSSQNSQTQTNGIYSQLDSPTGVAMDSEGNLFVASFSENVIYKITPEGKKIIIVKDARLSGPIGIAIDRENNIYVANYNKDNILKITPAGQINILLANVQKPYIVFIRDNMLYISSQGANSVIRYKCF